MTARSIAKALRGQWHGSYGTACCPAHDDRQPSLSITERDGKLLVHCFAGCPQEAVWAALKGMGLVDRDGPPLAQAIPARVRAHTANGKDTDYTALAKRIWATSVSATGTHPTKIEPAALNGRHGLQGRFTNTNWNQSHELSYDRTGCNAG